MAPLQVPQTDIPVRFVRSNDEAQTLMLINAADFNPDEHLAVDEDGAVIAIAEAPTTEGDQQPDGDQQPTQGTAEGGGTAPEGAQGTASATAPTTPARASQARGRRS